MCFFQVDSFILLWHLLIQSWPVISLLHQSMFVSVVDFSPVCIFVKFGGGPHVCLSYLVFTSSVVFIFLAVVDFQLSSNVCNVDVLCNDDVLIVFVVAVVMSPILCSGLPL